MTAAPDLDRIVARLEEGIEAVDKERVRLSVQRVTILNEANCMARRLEDLGRAHFVLAEQVTQLKEAIAARETRVASASPEQRALLKEVLAERSELCPICRATRPTIDAYCIAPEQPDCLAKNTPSSFGTTMTPAEY